MPDSKSVHTTFSPRSNLKYEVHSELRNNNLRPTNDILIRYSKQLIPAWFLLPNVRLLVHCQ
jgi:hypothetical protein